MRTRIIRWLAACVAVLCVLAACATAAGWLLLDGANGMTFLERVMSVEVLLTCGAALLVLCIFAFVAYVVRRRAAHT